MSDTAVAPNESKNDPAMQRALWRFFLGSDTPTVLCTGELVIVAANRAFGVRVGAQSETALSGVALSEIVCAKPSLPEAFAAGGRVAVSLPGGRSALANVAPVDDLFVITLDAGLEGARLAEASRVLEEQSRVLEIGRLLSLLMTEEDLVGVVAQGIRQLFQGRVFAIRVVDPQTMDLTSLYAEGALIPAEREKLTLKQTAIVKTRLIPEAIANARVVVRNEYHRIFEGTDAGIGVPLVAGNEIFGMINVEGSTGQFLDMESDGRVLISLANHLSVALRNARLLRESRYLRGYLEKLIDNANALIVVIDRNGLISVFNRACQELSGFSRDEVLGTEFVELLAPEDRTRIRRVVALAARGRSATNVEASVVTRDNRQIQVAFNTAAILDSDGQVESVIAIGNDLTRIWELERQVIQAEKLASLGQLAAAVVHELNNPLTSITVYAEYLRDRLGELGAGKDEEKAGRILESADRILKFTRNLVAYARPADERPTRLDVRHVVEQSIQLCEHVINDRNARLDLVWAPEKLPLVMGNQGKLQQVFINLITNACHAIEPGGTISIGAHRDEEQVEVTIRDDGHGMPDEVAEKIFEPFFSTKAPGRGTGLGLSIVHEIVKSHGGTITVESTQHEGTAFRLRLPVTGSDL
jgi:two-component system, NtrC family, sensor kinase